MPISELTGLADDFWTWRAVTQPVTGDDIPRIERAASWVPDWSPDAVAARHARLAVFERLWQALSAEAKTWPVPSQVDYRLIGSAIARVHWELNVLQSWRRNPRFYVHQSLGALFESLLQPPPFGADRVETLQRRLDNIPSTLDAARANLGDHAVAPF